MQGIGTAVGVGIGFYATREAGGLVNAAIPSWLRFASPVASVGAQVAAGVGVYLLGGVIGGKLGEGMQASTWLALIGAAAAAAIEAGGFESEGLNALSTFTPMSAAETRDLMHHY